ncbi:MAG: histidinol-phosphate aminotransferase [Pseudohongiellaceae bacterium]
MSEFASSYDPGVQVSADDTLCLHRNENLLVGTDWAVDAARAAIPQAAISSYPDATALPLRVALAEHYGVQPENVFVGNGADEVLADLLAALRPRYNSFGVLDVHFKIYDLLAERMGFQVEDLAGHSFDSGHVTADGFNGLALIDSPGAIAGSSVPVDEVLAFAKKEGSFLIWDNVYGEYAYHELPLPLPDNVVFVRSFSKFYGLAGLRVGYCIGEAGLIGRMLAQKDAFNVNSFGQVMALAALKRHDQFAALRDELVVQRTTLTRDLESLGFQVKPSDSVGVLATHPDHSAEWVQAELLKRRVAVRRFTDDKISNFIRVTAAAQSQMQHFLTVMKDVLGKA